MVLGVICLALIVAALPFMAACAKPAPAPKPAPKPVEWRMVSGVEGTGGYACGTALSKLITDNVPGLTVYVEAARAAAGMRYVSRGEVEICYTSPYILRAGYTGTDPFHEEPLGEVKPYQGYWFYPIQLYFVVRADSDMHTWDDMAGHKITTWRVATGIAPPMRDLLKAMGLWDKVDHKYVEEKLGADALSSGTVDAVMGWSIANQQIKAMVDIDARVKCRVLTMSEEQKKFITEFPGVSFIEAAPESAFKTQDIGLAKLPGVGIWYGYPYAPFADPDLAYQAVKAIFEHVDAMREISKLYHLWASDPKGTQISGISAIPDIPVHPGIARYYKEIGIWQPNWKEGKIVPRPK